jgi:preprotein translocase subunit SecG
MTTGVAVLFMLTSLVLAVLTTRITSVVKEEPVKEETTIPATSGPFQEQGKGPIQLPSEQKSQPQQPQQKQQVPLTPPKK